MAKCKSKVRVINGSTYVYFDEETRKDMEQIVNLSTGVFSKPFGERESKIFLDTIIDMQLAYSDDIADLEEVLRAILDAKKVSYPDFENIRKNKVEKRGAFKNKIFLEDVI